MPRPERPLDPDGGPAQRFALGLRALRVAAGNPGYREMAARVHYSAAALSAAANGRKLPTLDIALAYVRACAGDEAVWRARWQEATQELTPPEPVFDGVAPYLGLAAFQSEDADRFFGRERLVADLVARLARAPFLAVYGASGSGKSSLLRAGLLPALTQAQPTWSPVVFTPGADPLRECAVRLAARAGVTAGTLAAELAADPSGLALVVRQALAEQPEDAQLVLVVDQFEEVFTLCTDRQTRNRFVSALVSVAVDGQSRARVVLGVRADFYARCAEHPDLVAALSDAQLLVGPMTEHELTEAVTRPAQRAGLMVDKALVATIVEQARDRPGALPLVSHALLETWRRRQGSALTLAGYQATGGVDGAVAQSAERVYQGLDDRTRRRTRDVFLRLTALGEGTEDTRRRVDRAELGADEELARVLDQLAAARLVTLGRQSVEMAHEALIGGWPRLREWLAEDREQLRAHRGLTVAAAEWQRHGRDESELYQGNRLALCESIEVDRLNELEREFLRASRARITREQTARARRRKLTLTALVATAVVMAVLAAGALFAVRQATEERDLAYSHQLVAMARGRLDRDPELGLLLAVRAFQSRPTAEAQSLLRQATLNSRLRLARPMNQGRVVGVAINGKGDLVATSGEDGTVDVLRADGQGAPTVLRGHEGPAWSPVFSPDGTRLASTGADRAVLIWHLGSAEPPVRLDWVTGLWGLSYSPDGTRLAGAAADGTIVLWDLATRTARTLTGHTGDVSGIAFSPDGRHLASGGADGTLRVWDSATGQQVSLRTGHQGTVDRVTYDRSGRHLATAGIDGTVRVWPAEGGDQPLVLHGHDEAVESVAFTPDGNRVVSGGADGTVRIWSTTSEANPLVLRGHHGEVWNVVTTPDGRRVFSGGNDGSLRIWDSTVVGDPKVLSGHVGSVAAAVFDRSGRRVVSGGADGTVRLWDTGGTGESSVLATVDGEVRAVAFSADGRSVAAASDQGRIEVRAADGHGRPVVLTGHRDVVSGLAFNPSGTLLASAGDDGTVRLWHTDGSGEPRVLANSAGEPARGVAFSPDGRWLAAALHDGTVRVWPADGHGDPVVLQGSQGPVWKVAFSPDSSLLASGGNDGTVRVWHTGTWGDPLVQHGHDGLVWSLGFSADGKQLVSAGNDHTMRIWNTDGAGEPLVVTGQGAAVNSAEFSADGHLVTTHEDGTVRVGNCPEAGPIEGVLALAQAHSTRELTPEENRLASPGQ
ncbi:hypothetical protein GCM10010174_84310 [Kutzneria viridogrisea]|uniref:WD40 repeat protein/energy-coupling factor transporter ATP-binding protein EcfA2 n=1 Tax=Kutzneria viridogrisea TaxID=47990 RepID=A0ABR6BF46_9PSEU|nr:WD40 repeat protein/energy-coupling factor transporter ATP-binding protein EcfA2 [Kutzneria viridogrisea]